MDVGCQIPDVGTAIEQVVELRHDLFSSGRISLQGGIPFACGGLKLRIDFAEFQLKIFLSGFEARFQGGQIAAQGFGFAKLVEKPRKLAGKRAVNLSLIDFASER